MPDRSTLGTLLPDEFRRIREIFEAALECPLAERQGLVERACGENLALRAEVERMLAAEGARHRLLDGAVAARPADPGAHAAPTVCPACQAPTAGAHRFCPSCGTPLVDAGVVEEGRFRAGALFAGRFRIVAALGHGGMGEVYRAYDLELGQPVALKFLTRLRSDERAGARLRTEVRLARQIAHPNVCRVYDIGESQGDLYLSMEYVDGENLAVLLRRIGRLPVDKGLEIGRRLCAGLSAAHARGVLHRDFKPANIMVDASGEVRIMDFGLATSGDALEGRESGGGTPLYMAPEQLAGREATRQSDLYALGLVLYELFTGKAPFAARDAAGLQRQRESHPQTTPSTLIPEIDARLERVILRCLEPDPRERPGSALDVARALPGGDPLAAALEAGETPSPETVAAAGEVGTVSVAAGVGGLAAIALGIAAVAWISPGTALSGYDPPNLSVERLAERARAIAADLGLETPAADSAYGYEVDEALLQHLRETDASPARWETLRSSWLDGFRFWYRQSARPRASSLETFLGWGSEEGVASTLAVTMDSSGRLLRLAAVLPDAPPAGGSTERAWHEGAFRHAALDVADFDPAVPERVPPVFVDERRAWTGVLPDERATPVRIEAGAHEGRLVYLERIMPWTPDAPSGRSDGIPPIFVAWVLIVASVGLVRRNVRLGRADRAAAFRTAVGIGITELMWLVLLEVDASFLLTFGIPLAVCDAVAAWMLYVALEPFVRREWPEMLVGWRRLLFGRLRDPLVGRDVLAGVLAGILLALAMLLGLLLPTWLGSAPAEIERTPGGLELMLVMGGRFAGAAVALTLYEALIRGLIVTLALALLAMLLRSRLRGAVALIALLLVLVTPPPVASPVWVAGLALALAVGIFNTFVLFRFGLLAVVVQWIPALLLTNVALRFDVATPLAMSSYLLVAIAAALALYGFRIALGGRPILGEGF